ncbi:Serine/threonine-protein kinase, partial [Lachnellula hyalina]
MEPNRRAEYKEIPLQNHSLPTIPWHKEAEFQAPGLSSLRPPNASSNSLGVHTSDSDISSVISDLGDAKQLAQTRDRGHFRSATRTGLLVSHAGTSFPDNTNQLGSIDSDILPQPKSLEHQDKKSAARNTYQNLGRKIRFAQQISSWEGEGKKFLPFDKLEQHTTRKAIHEELEQQGSDASLVNEIWEAGQFRTSSLTTRRRIFAILVLLDQVPAIIDFIRENIYDRDLPFVFQEGTGEREGSYNVYRKVKQRNGDPDMEIELQFFQKWKDVTLEAFHQNQWQLLAPFFSLASKDSTKVSHYNLDSHIVLPFVEDHIVDEPPAQYGGSAEVRRVKIHRAHQDLYMTGDEADNPSFAVKRLSSNDPSAFDNEVETLKLFSGKNKHQHLINLLLTYHYRGHYHLLFHWADGNLLDYWKTRHPSPHTPTRDGKFAKWVSRQWLGVVEGLQAIHTYTADPNLPFHDTQDPIDPRIHGRHGDLKPENILWFNRPHSAEGSTDHFGSFVISDFGLTRFHRELTRSRVNPETLGWSPTYRPPEYDVQKEVSQKCDIWSLGCVLLEFLHWYLLGWKGVKDFQNSRIDEGGSPEMRLDGYYNYIEDDPSQKGTRFKRSVKKAFQHLRSDLGTTEFFLEFLNLVQFKLLRMDPAKRASCGEIVELFKEINGKCLRENGYCTVPIRRPRRSSTDLSELMATPTAPLRQPSMPFPEKYSKVNEAPNVRLTTPNSRHLKHETISAPRARELGIHTGEVTQPAHKLEISSNPITKATPIIDDVDEGVDTNMEQDSQISSPKKIHFAKEDSGIVMNNDDTDEDYSGSIQNKEGMSDADAGKLTEEEQDAPKHSFTVRASHSPDYGTYSTQDKPIETRLVDTMDSGEQRAMEPANEQKEQNMNQDTLANNHTTDQTSPQAASNSSPTARSAFMLNHSGYHTMSGLASTSLRPKQPHEMSSPDSPPNASTETVEDEILRPLLGRCPTYDAESSSYEENEHSRLRK